jgi:hypothetical protein
VARALHTSGGEETTEKGRLMIFYIIGVIVVIAIVLAFLF